MMAQFVVCSTVLTISQQVSLHIPEITPNLCCVDAEQCKYGKNRVEADAKRLQSKEEELMKRKQEIRNHLTQLKKERRDLRNAVEAAAGKTDRPPAEYVLVMSEI